MACLHRTLTKSNQSGILGCEYSLHYVIKSLWWLQIAMIGVKVLRVNYCASSTYQYNTYKQIYAKPGY